MRNKNTQLTVAEINTYLRKARILEMGGAAVDAISDLAFQQFY